MIFLVLILSYVIGSIPFGFLVVKSFSGRDVREVGSGRTGGTNAMRAAGVPAGVLTAVLDTLKAAACVWMARLILPADQQVIGMVLSGLLAIWPWSFVIAVPLCMLVLFGIGYASLATIAAGLIITALFAYRTYVLHAPDAPAAFILYGVGSLILLVWALRPNIRRLLRGEERLIGWRARRLKQAAAAADTSTKGR